MNDMAVLTFQIGLSLCVRFCNKEFNVHESTSVTENCACAVVTSSFGTNFESDVTDVMEQEKIHL
jgi:hypothetical protein